MQSGTGLLVAVVGSSGAGKDSLIRFACASLPANTGIYFVKRVVTRPPGAGAEEHTAMSEAEFAAAEAAGAFALTWQAHGLCYGVPVAGLEHVRAGGLAVLNGSRAALGRTVECFGRVQVIEVTASPEAIASRLGGRRRETAEDIERRLARRIDHYPGADGAIRIDNSGALETAGQAFTDILLRLAR